MREAAKRWGDGSLRWPHAQTHQRAAPRPSQEGSNSMADIINEPTEDEITSIEISDESLEAAALAGIARAYTQFGLCTISLCPGS
jgi:hypothetical protein